MDACSFPHQSLAKHEPVRVQASSVHGPRCQQQHQGPWAGASSQTSSEEGQCRRAKSDAPGGHTCQLADPPQATLGAPPCLLQGNQRTLTGPGNILHDWPQDLGGQLRLFLCCRDNNSNLSLCFTSLNVHEGTLVPIQGCTAICVFRKTKQKTAQPRKAPNSRDSPAPLRIAQAGAYWKVSSPSRTNPGSCGC